MLITLPDILLADLLKIGSLVITILLILYLMIFEILRSTENEKAKQSQKVFIPIAIVLAIVFILLVISEFVK